MVKSFALFWITWKSVGTLVLPNGLIVPVPAIADAPAVLATRMPPAKKAALFCVTVRPVASAKRIPVGLSTLEFAVKLPVTLLMTPLAKADGAAVNAEACTTPPALVAA